MQEMSNCECEYAFDDNNQLPSMHHRVAEYKRILSALEIVTSRETSTGAGMKKFLEKVMMMLTHQDLIDPNYFVNESSKARRAIWDPVTCLQIASAMPPEAKDLYNRILAIDVKNEQTLKAKRGESKWLRREIMGVIARDALRGTVQNELRIAEKVADLEYKRHDNFAKIITENKMRRSFCKCEKRCVESYHGSCKYNGKISADTTNKCPKYDRNRTKDNESTKRESNKKGETAVAITIKEIMDNNGIGISINIPSLAR